MRGKPWASHVIELENLYSGRLVLKGDRLLPQVDLYAATEDSSLFPFHAVIPVRGRMLKGTIYLDHMGQEEYPEWPHVVDYLSEELAEHIKRIEDLPPPAARAAYNPGVARSDAIEDQIQRVLGAEAQVRRARLELRDAVESFAAHAAKLVDQLPPDLRIPTSATLARLVMSREDIEPALRGVCQIIRRLERAKPP